jgi:hypothetical protein
MDLIKNYENACDAIAKHAGYDDFIGNYTISTEFIDCFYSFFAEIEEIGWAESLKDLDEQDREYYQAECSGFYEGAEFTLALIEPDCGGDKYWAVFKTLNKIPD